MEFDLTILRAIVGEKSFKNIVTDEILIEKICSKIPFKTWIDLDKSLASSFNIQRNYNVKDVFNRLSENVLFNGELFKYYYKDALKDNGDGTFDYYGNARTEWVDLQFKHIDGDYNISFMSLTEIKNAPSSVYGDFNCSSNDITTLKGSPEVVNGYFYCQDNEYLTSLVGAPEKIGGSFNTKYTSIRTLEGAPRHIGNDFHCDNNDELISLVGSPNYIGRHFYCSECTKLTSLEGAPKEVGGNFIFTDNGITVTEEEIRAVCNVGGNVYC